MLQIMDKKPTEPIGKITMRFPASQVARIKTCAAIQGVAMADVLDTAFNEYVKGLPADLRKTVDDAGKVASKIQKVTDK